MRTSPTEFAADSAILQTGGRIEDWCGVDTQWGLPFPADLAYPPTGWIEPLDEVP